MAETKSMVPASGIRHELHKAKLKLAAYKERVSEALDEAHHPVKLTAEDLTGGLLGWALFKGSLFVAGRASLKEGEVAQPTFGPRKPSGWAALGSMVLGAGQYAANLAIERDAPFGFMRAAWRSESATTFMFGFNELADWGAMKLAQKKAADAIKKQLADQQAQALTQPPAK